MSSLSELAIRNTEIWLDESHIEHQRVSHNGFLVTDHTTGIPRYDIELMIGEKQVSYVSKVVGPFGGPTSGLLAVAEACLQHNYRMSGPALAQAEDGSLVLRANYDLLEHSPYKMFTTLGSFEPIQKIVGPSLISIAAEKRLHL